jgi:hypothetical protein
MVAALRGGQGSGGSGGRRTRTGGATRATGAVQQRGNADVVVGYTPDDDGHADPGEVVWTWVPYEDDPRQGPVAVPVLRKSMVRLRSAALPVACSA